jgi:sugar/nucleoside kinase (ribokinase family)
MDIDVTLIGNFVNDVIVKASDGGVETTTRATGGSVTYGSLAAATYGCSPRVITTVGDDLPEGFLKTLEAQNIIFVGDIKPGKNTSYKLYYDANYNRTLSLMEKGFPIQVNDVLKNIGKPDAIFFVPIAAEFDETLLIDVVSSLLRTHADTSYHPIVAMDVQGFIRTFVGKRVSTRSTVDMIAKFKTLSVLQGLGVTTILKAEYAEASAIVGPLDPKEAALQLRKDFGFDIVSVTMGPLGGYLSSSLTGEVYVPTFKPKGVMDETGCGDTFLTTAVLELLHAQKQNKDASAHGVFHAKAHVQTHLAVTSGQLLHAFLVGSAAASFLVECIGPQGFATREKLLERISSGERTLEESAQTKFSITRYKPPK